MTKDYPMWVCHDCGTKHGKYCVGTSTYHHGICGVCVQMQFVTSPRDYGYPKFPKESPHGSNP